MVPTGCGEESSCEGDAAHIREMRRKCVAVGTANAVLRLYWVVVLDLIDAPAKAAIRSPLSALRLARLIETVVGVNLAGAITRRSPWSGALQADAAILRRAIGALSRVLFFIDEAMRKGRDDKLATHLRSETSSI